MNVDPAVLHKLIVEIGVMSAVIAAGIAAVFQLFNGWRERLAADKRHLRELALKAAIVQWEHDVAENKAERSSFQIGEKPKPLNEVHFDMILVKKLKLIETFGSGKKLSNEEVTRGIREMGRITGAIEKQFGPKDR